MKFWFGVLFGVLLTVAVVFAYDSLSGRAPNGLVRSAADGHSPVVNWDVVRADWDEFGRNLQALGEDIQTGWRKLGG